MSPPGPAPDASSPAPLGLGPAVALAVLAGILYFVGFVGFGVHPLTWIAFVPVLFAVRGQRRRRVWGLSVLFGTVTMCGGYYWIVHLLQEFAYLPLPLAVLGYLLLCAYQGFLLALAVVLCERGRARLGLAPVWTLPVGYVALELAYPLLFPHYVGNSLYELSFLTQIVELTGMGGLTVLVGLVNGGFYEVVEARRDGRAIVARRAVVPIAAYLLVAGYGLVRLPMIDAEIAAAPKLRVAMVQTNLGARDKADHRDEFIRRHQAMSAELVAADPAIDLVVWPESAYNRWISRSTDDLSPVLGPLGKPVLFGALTWDRAPDGRERRYNTALLTDARGQKLGLFDKIELLAFGETIPLIETVPQIRKWFPRSSVFDRGTEYRPLALAPDVKLLPMICYEDILPAFVRRLWNRGGAAEALVNITNDSWYGDTHEPLIHLVLATFRTIETRRALIRSTNTGISAFVDPAGRIVKRTGQWTKETLVDEVPLVRDGSSTLYMAVGDVLGWLGLALVALGLWRSRGRGAPAPEVQVAPAKPSPPAKSKRKSRGPRG